MQNKEVEYLRKEFRDMHFPNINNRFTANEYNVNTSLASQAVFLSTLCSVVTIPLISFILLK